MSGDVERVALSILNSDRTRQGLQPCDSFDQLRPRAAAFYVVNATAAMRETRLIDAETANRLANYAARPMGDDAEYYRKWKSAADWLTTRAGDQP